MPQPYRQCKQCMSRKQSKQISFPLTSFSSPTAKHTLYRISPGSIPTCVSAMFCLSSRGTAIPMSAQAQAKAHPRAQQRPNRQPGMYSLFICSLYPSLCLNELLPSTEVSRLPVIECRTKTARIQYPLDPQVSLRIAPSPRRPPAVRQLRPRPTTLYGPISIGPHSATFVAKRSG